MLQQNTKPFSIDCLNYETTGTAWFMDCGSSNCTAGGANEDTLKDLGSKLGLLLDNLVVSSLTHII